MDIASTDVGIAGPAQTDATKSSNGVSRIALNIDEAASALGVSRRTIEGMIDRGEIKACMVGRRLLIGVDHLRKFFQR